MKRYSKTLFGSSGYFWTRLVLLLAFKVVVAIWKPEFYRMSMEFIEFCQKILILRNHSALNYIFYSIVTRYFNYVILMYFLAGHHFFNDKFSSFINLISLSLVGYICGIEKLYGKEARPWMTSGIIALECNCSYGMPDENITASVAMGMAILVDLNNKIQIMRNKQKSGYEINNMKFK